MGGAESRAQMIKRFNKISPKRWETVRKEGLTQIAVDEDGREGQVNIVSVDPKAKIEQQLEVYFFRRNQSAPIVKCYGAEPITNDQVGVCGVHNKIKVITERIIKRWGEVPQLTFPEALYALKQAMEGYKILFKEVGPFEVTKNMMGLNNKGYLNVWLNQNMAQNYPNYQKGVLFTTEDKDNLQKIDTKEQMIENICYLIEQKCENGNFPADFKQLLRASTWDFDSCIHIVNQYVKSKELLLPSRIHPENQKMYVNVQEKVPPKALSPLKISGFRITQSQLDQNSPLRPKKFDSIVQSIVPIVPNGRREQSPLMTPKHTQIVGQKLTDSRIRRLRPSSPGGNLRRSQQKRSEGYAYIPSGPAPYVKFTTGSQAHLQNSIKQQLLNLTPQSPIKQINRSVGIISAVPLPALTSPINVTSGRATGKPNEYADFKNPNVVATESIYQKEYKPTEKSGDYVVDNKGYSVSYGGQGNASFTTYTGPTPTQNITATTGVSAPFVLANTAQTKQMPQSPKQQAYERVERSSSNSKPMVKFNYQAPNLTNVGNFGDLKKKGQEMQTSQVTKQF